MTATFAGQFLAAVFFFVILAVLMSGYIVAWTLGGLSIIFALLGWWFGVFDLNLLTSLATRFFGTITNPCSSLCRSSSSWAWCSNDRRSRKFC